MTDFDRELSALLARYAVKHKADIDGLSDMVERLASGLGSTIAILVEGDHDAIDKMSMAVEGMIHETAVSKARMVALLNRAKALRLDAETSRRGGA